MPKLTTHNKLAKLDRIPFTKEGYAELEKKLKRLKEERPSAVKELARARELGDLSENGLYTAAKARLGSIDGQIFRIEMTMKFADVVDGKNSDTITIGSMVMVESEGNEVTYKIVGDTETSPKERKISQHSPIGQALVGKSVGDTALIDLPSGKTALKILKIS